MRHSGNPLLAVLCVMVVAGCSGSVRSIGHKDAAHFIPGITTYYEAVETYGPPQAVVFSKDGSLMVSWFSKESDFPASETKETVFEFDRGKRFERIVGEVVIERSGMTD